MFLLLLLLFLLLARFTHRQHANATAATAAVATMASATCETLAVQSTALHFGSAIKISNIVKTNKKFIEYAAYFAFVFAFVWPVEQVWFIVLFIVGEKSNICGWQPPET